MGWTRAGLGAAIIVLWSIAGCGGDDTDSAASDARPDGAAGDGDGDRGGDGDGDRGDGDGDADPKTGGPDPSGDGGSSGGGGPDPGSGGVSNSSGGTGGGGPACLPAGTYCTRANADDCCSGACDGDSCCGFLGDACPNGFGCCHGSCIGGTCRCPPGTLDCGNGCVGIEWNEDRCGDCDTRCGENSVCEQGSCLCDPNLFDAQFYVRCPGGCFNTRSDQQHCGDCSTVCEGGTRCSGGNCECPAGTRDCGNGCVDITANSVHCGSCGNGCDVATEQCVNRQCTCRAGLFACTPGTCVDRQTDTANCGTCGNVCMGNKTCQAGVCSN